MENVMGYSYGIFLWDIFMGYFYGITLGMIKAHFHLIVSILKLGVISCYIPFRLSENI